MFFDKLYSKSTAGRNTHTKIRLENTKIISPSAYNVIAPKARAADMPTAARAVSHDKLYTIIGEMSTNIVA